MTNVTKDQKAFHNMKNTYTTVLATKSNNPEPGYIRTQYRAPFYLGSKLALSFPEASTFESIHYDACLKCGISSHSNAKDFTFYFVGNYDEKVSSH